VGRHGPGGIGHPHEPACRGRAACVRHAGRWHRGAFPPAGHPGSGIGCLVADDDQAPALFEEALSLPTLDQWPFDVARVRLAHGKRLRRTRATTESRIPLGMALTTFQKLGAVP